MQHVLENNFLEIFIVSPNVINATWNTLSNVSTVIECYMTPQNKSWNE